MKVFAIVGAVLVLVGNLEAVTSRQVEDRMLSEMREIVQGSAEQGVVIGVIYLDENTGVKEEVFAGGMAVEESVFRIGSMTQGFTAMLLAYLIEQGTVKGDDPVQGYLPDGIWLPIYNGKQITFIDLATHTSGLPDMPSNLRFIDQYKTYSKEDLFDAVNELRLARMPGGKVEYSRLGYAILGIALEGAAKKSWPKLFGEIIKDKLDLNDTSISLTKDQKKRFLAGMTVEGKEIDSVDLIAADSPFMGSQGLFSNVQDQMKWLKYLLEQGGTDLNFLLPIMLETCRKIEGEKFYCLGFQSWQERPKRYHIHSMQFGFGVYLGFMPDERTAVVIITNKSIPLEHRGKNLLQFLIKKKAS